MFVSSKMDPDPVRISEFDPVAATAVRTQIIMPFDHLINPYEEQVRLLCLERAVRSKLIPDTAEGRGKKLKYKFGMLCAVFYPTISKLQLEVAGEFMYWIFAFDDLCDNDDCVSDPAVEPRIRVIEERMYKILNGGILNESEEEPIVRALYYMLRNCEAISNPRWFKEFCQSLKIYIEAVRWERKLRNIGEVPTYNTFEKMRVLASAVGCCFYLGAMFLCKDSPEIVTKNAYLMELLRMTTIHVQSVNDFFSVAKDIRDCTSDNTVVVLAKEKQLSWPEALDYTLDLINKEMRAFLSLESKLEDMMGTLHPDVVTSVRVMKHLMRGNWEWSNQSSRYQDINSTED